MVVFNKQIQYEDAFTTHLTYKQAEQWLANNRYKVNQVLASLKSDLVAKYGTPHLEREKTAYSGSHQMEMSLK